MAKYIKNIFFMLLFVVQAACSFDGSFPFDLGLSDARSFEEWCGLGTGFAGDQDPLINSHSESGIFVIEDSGNSFDSTPNEWGCGLGFSNVGSIVADDYLNVEERPEELLEGQGIGNETGAGNCLVESQALSVEGSSSSSSSSSSVSSSNDEAGNTIRAFTAAVQCLPIVERMSNRLYACPISTCNRQAKRMPLMEEHLKSHYEGQVACIFCEKALYSQNIANSHYCKCPFCDVKCRVRANAIKFMAEHVQNKHPYFLAHLVNGFILGDFFVEHEGFVPGPGSSSSSSFDSSLNEWGSGFDFSSLGSIVADDCSNPGERSVELLEGQGSGNGVGADDCLIESPVLSVASSSSGSSSSSSASSSSDEAGNTIRAFTAAVQCLPIIERMSDRLYACPISTCDHQAKKMPLMEGHLKSHHEGQVACIFCEKALYSQNIANSHYCKCPFCDVKCRMQANVVKFMTEHVQKRHPHFLVFLVSAPTPGGFIPDSSNSSSSSFDSSLNEFAKKIEAFTDAVKQLARIEKVGGAYKCLISGCEKLAEKKSLLEGHLKCHNASLAVCIFCKKELYSQDIAKSHYCKCPFCDVKGRNQVNVIKFMSEHVRERHPNSLALLVGGFVPDLSSSSSSSFDLSSNESVKAFGAFRAAVKQLPKIEKDGSFYKCPISGCGKFEKIKSNLEKHLKSHNESQITCIFCKKELYSQDNANSHNCKCSVCALECRMPTGVIDRMAKHVRERHSQLAKELGIIQIDEGFARSSDVSSSSSLLIQIENARSKITYTCVLCTYSTGRKTDMYKHIYAKHFNASGVECPTCTSKIYEFDRTHRCKFPSEPQFTQAYLDEYPQFTEATYQELPELRRVKKCASTYYTCPYCDKWRDARGDALNYHIYRLHTLARKETCLACGKPMYMKGGLEEHAGKCSAGDSVSSSSSSSSSSLLALTSALSASKSKRGRSSSSNVNEDVEEADALKRLCTPSLQPVSPEQWSPLEFPFSEEQGDQFGDDSSKSLG